MPHAILLFPPHPRSPPITVGQRCQFPRDGNWKAMHVRMAWSVPNSSIGEKYLTPHPPTDFPFPLFLLLLLRPFIICLHAYCIYTQHTFIPIPISHIHNRSEGRRRRGGRGGKARRFCICWGGGVISTHVYENRSCINEEFSVSPGKQKQRVRDNGPGEGLGWGGGGGGGGGHYQLVLERTGQISRDGRPEGVGV